MDSVWSIVSCRFFYFLFLFFLFSSFFLYLFFTGSLYLLFSGIRRDIQTLFLQLLQHFFLGLQAGAELRHSLQTAVISEFDPQICGELSKIHTGYGVSAVE